MEKVLWRYTTCDLGDVEVSPSRDLEIGRERKLAGAMRGIASDFDVFLLGEMARCGKKKPY